MLGSLGNWSPRKNRYHSRHYSINIYKIRTPQLDKRTKKGYRYIQLSKQFNIANTRDECGSST